MTQHVQGPVAHPQRRQLESLTLTTQSSHQMQGFHPETSLLIGCEVAGQVSCLLCSEEVPSYPVVGFPLCSSLNLPCVPNVEKLIRETQTLSCVCI